MNVQKYTALIRSSIIMKLQFKLSVFVQLIGNAVYLVIVYFLWKAIFASVENGTVNGMTFNDTMIYLVLAAAMFNFMETFLVWDIGRSITSGDIILDMLRPMKYPLYMLYSAGGEMVFNFLFTFVPTAAAVWFITGGGFPLGINIVFFIVSCVLGILINFCINFFVGTICLYTQSIWGLNIMKEVIVSFLSGATIPLAFFPDKLRTVVNALPFQTIYNTPLSILLGKETDILRMTDLVGIQCAWLAVLTAITALFWKLSSKVITVNGG